MVVDDGGRAAGAAVPAWHRYGPSSERTWAEGGAELAINSVAPGAQRSLSRFGAVVAAMAQDGPSGSPHPAKP